MEVRKRLWNRISFSTALFVFILITNPIFLFSQAQNFRITHYTTNDGLSQNYVYCILQDSKGFMWFGTRDGLNKFDGYTFTHYKHRPFDEKSISHNIICYLLEDKDGMIWIATGGGGLCRYDRFKNEFISLRHNSNNPQSLSDNYLQCLYLDDSRKLWIGTLGGGLSVLDIPAAEKKMRTNPRLPLDSIFTFINYRHDSSNTNSLGSDVVCGIVQDRLGNFLINTNSVLDHFEPNEKKWTHYYWSPIGSPIKVVSNPEKIVHRSSVLNNFLKDKKGDLWLGSGFLLRFDSESRTFINYKKIIDGPIFCEDWSSNFWSGLEKLYVTPKKKLVGKNREMDKLPKPIFTSNGLFSGCMDTFGSVWIGTVNGVYKFDPSSSGFRHISRSIDENEHNEFDVRSLHEDLAGNIWLGTAYNSLRILDRKSGLIASPVKGPILSNPTSVEKVVNVIYQDSYGNYWIGTRAGVYFSQNRSHSIKRLFYGMKDANGSSIYWNIFSLLIDHHGRIWFGGIKGYKSFLLKYNKVLNTVDSTASPLNEVLQKSGTGIWKFLEDSKHRIWIGTTNGVFLVDEPSEKITHFFYKAEDNSSLSHDETWMIFEDHAGNIWIGTMGGGLNLWHQQTGNFTHFTQDNGLAGNIVFGILEDEQSNLWISTNNGISKFNPDTKVFRNYLTPEIRSIGQFNNACLKTKDGFMLFGGQNGIIYFHPDSIREDCSYAPIVITSFSILGKEIRNEINQGDEISIPYKDNYFSIEYAALDYRNSPKLQYAYKLEGVNNNWMNVGTQRFCSYSNLSPGDYLFRIKATNSDDVWNEKGIAILIHIVPPIYLTSWFKWSIGMLMLLLIVGLVYWRMDFLHRKELNRRRLIESELQALRLQMNPHFIFNSLNAIQNFVINSDAEKATEYLSKFARLMRMILENSKQQTIHLKDEIEFLHLYLEIESVRFEERFDYTIQVDPALSGDFEIPSMLLQPYIENAIRHGLLHRTSMGKLTIILALVEDTIVASIIDNGIGRKKAMEIKERQGYSHKAFGMEITHDRLKILNSFRKKEMRLNVIDLYDETGEPNGTQIEISIPV